MECCYALLPSYAENQASLQYPVPLGPGDIP